MYTSSSVISALWQKPFVRKTILITIALLVAWISFKYMSAKIDDLEKDNKELTRKLDAAETTIKDMNATDIINNDVATDVSNRKDSLQENTDRIQKEVKDDVADIRRNTDSKKDSDAVHRAVAERVIDGMFAVYDCTVSDQTDCSGRSASEGTKNLPTAEP